MQEAPVCRIVCLSAMSEHCLSDLELHFSVVSRGTLNKVPSVDATEPKMREPTRAVVTLRLRFTSALFCSKLSSALPVNLIGINCGMMCDYIELRRPMC